MENVFIQNIIGQKKTSFDIREIMDRISVATRNSQILVIRNQRGLDCFFANTVYGKYFIESRKGDVVGCFDATMNPGEIRRKLSQWGN